MRIIKTFASTAVLFGSLASVPVSQVVAATQTPAVAVGPQYDTTHVYVAPDDFDRLVCQPRHDVWRDNIQRGRVHRYTDTQPYRVAACPHPGSRSQIIWAKSQLVISRGHYHAEHEPCFYAVRDGRTGHWTGDRKQTTLWQIDKPMKSETGHSTQKPVECMRRPIDNNSSPGQAVYEPFSGSGTTIIAAEMTGRVAQAIEITPAYVGVAVKRWQEFTGRQAVLDGNGRDFDDVAAQRPRAEDPA